MAIFTFDDLNEMEHAASEFFGPSNSDELSEEFAPSTESLDLIKGYSRSISIRQTDSLGNIKMHLN
jgi:hypothetical protein